MLLLQQQLAGGSMAAAAPTAALVPPGQMLQASTADKVDSGTLLPPVQELWVLQAASPFMVPPLSMKQGLHEGLDAVEDVRDLTAGLEGIQKIAQMCQQGHLSWDHWQQRSSTTHSRCCPVHSALQQAAQHMQLCRTWHAHLTRHNQPHTLLPCW